LAKHLNAKVEAIMVNFAFQAHQEQIMPEPAFVTHIARTLYDLELQSMESLDQYQNPLRGIYRVQDAQDRSWVMRLSQYPETVDAFTHAADLLDWLTHRSYPAPSVRRTADQQLVGLIDGWAVMFLSYVAGTVLTTPSAEELGALAQTVGRLHRLRGDTQHSFAHSRCHPTHIATAAQQLAKHSAKVPEAFQTLVADLHAAMRSLQQLRQRLCLTHGDCWYANAIKADDGRLTLIDWDHAGIGLPLLDLGNLLLTAHFDLRQPLYLEADDTKIRAMMQGYQQECQISAREKASIVDAMRFLLAFQLGSYVADDVLFLNPEFPFVLQKLQARYDVTYDIADIAAKYID
jgi:Ser/Thr protein kinase RdoA (MazF antagonist)